MPGHGLGQHGDGHGTMTNRRFGARRSGLLLLGAIGGLLTIAGGCPEAGGPVTLDVLLPLTGDLASWGTSFRTAAELAGEEVNADPALGGVRLRFHDTGTDPREALAKLMALHAENRDLRFVIGPASSEEAANLRLYADRNDIVLLSPTSTSSQLSTAGDTLYRLLPDDTARAGALVAAMKAEGVAYFLVICRGDAYGSGLTDEIRARTLEFHGARLTYEPGTTDFTPHLDAVLEHVRAQAGSIAPSEIGVIIAGFDETALLMAQAANYSQLADLRWYCSEGWTGHGELLTDPVVGPFLARTQLTATQPGVDREINADWRERVSAEFEARTGARPDAQSMLFHDAVWAAAMTQDGLARRVSRSTLTSTLVETLNGFCGITGCLSVDTEGDRQVAVFDYVRVKPVGNAHAWVEVGTFKRDANGLESVTWNGE